LIPKSLSIHPKYSGDTPDFWLSFESGFKNYTGSPLLHARN